MFSNKDFPKLILILTTLLFLHVPILFVIYNDLVYALAVPVLSGVAGLLFPVAFMWEYIFTLSDEIGYPWFWSQFIAIYTFWVVGVITVRYRAILKSIYIRKRYEEIKSRTVSDDNQDEELGKDARHELQ